MQIYENIQATAFYFSRFDRHQRFCKQFILKVRLRIDNKEFMVCTLSEKSEKTDAAYRKSYE